jgi:hypothetical protein
MSASRHASFLLSNTFDLANPRLRIRNLLHGKMTANQVMYSFFYPHCSAATAAVKKVRALPAFLSFSPSLQSLMHNLESK